MGKNEGAKKELVIIDSKNKTKGRGESKDIILTVRAKDLPSGIKKDDLVAAFKVNAEREDEKGKDRKSKFKAKYLVPIVLPLVLLGAVKGCVNQQGYVDVQAINSTQYSIESPYVYMEGVVNASGQEGMTANQLDGDIAMDGDYYNAKGQFANEERASMGQEEFEQMEEQLQESMKTLTSSEATQQEKYEAAQRALGINQKIEKIYIDNLEFIESQGESFEEAANAFKDAHTDEEISVIRATIDEYKENLGLSSSNVSALSQIVQLTNDGYSIEITGNENARGDYTISGKALKEVAEQVGYDKEAEKTFDDFVENREQDKAIEDIGG